MKKGFTLLEVMLGIFIGSLLTGMLVQSLWQLGKTLVKIETVSQEALQSVTLYNLLEKELSGAFVPDLIPIEGAGLGKAVKSDQSGNDNKKQEQKIEHPPRAFFSQNENGVLALLTFITSNPLQVYNVSKPRVARIVYELVPSKNIPGSSTLYRYESENMMEVEKITSDIKGFVVVDGIVSLECTYLAALQEVKDQKQQDVKSEKKVQQEEQKQKEFKSFAQWKSDEFTEEKQRDSQKKLPLLPDFIKMKVTFVIDNKGTTHELEWVFAPKFGIDPIVLKGIKPLPEKQQPTTTDEKLTDIMGRYQLSESTEDKFSNYFGKQSERGPVTGGMQR